MKLPKSDQELKEFLDGEFFEEIPYIRLKDASEGRVSYSQFVLKLTEREQLYSHLELVSCVTAIDEVYHLMYDYFIINYGIVNFEKYPVLQRKFSPALLVLFLDSYNRKGVVKREYSYEGMTIALVEKAIYSKVYFTDLNLQKRSIHYKDFLLELLSSKDVSPLMFDRVMAIGRNTLLKGQFDAEIDDRVMFFFRTLYSANPELPKDQYEIQTFKFLFSTIGLYNCVTHLSEYKNVHDLIPQLHIKIMSESDTNPQSLSSQSLITIIILALAVIGLVSLCSK